MEPVTYSNRDAKVIKDNPGKSPYDLQALGLSGKGFEKLMSQQSTGAEPLADPTIDDEDESEPAAPAASNTDQQPAPGHEDEDNEDKQDPPASASPPAPLIPKITQIKQPQTPAAAVKLLPNQVLVQTPMGKTNPMGREFAEKLVKMDPNYKIIRR